MWRMSFEKVAAQTELKKSEAEAAVDSILAMITEALKASERVDLRGFGSFMVKERKERQGRNPRTGETITIAAKRDASFKPGKELTEKLAQHETPPIPEVAPPPRKRQNDANPKSGRDGGGSWLR
jgi:DNA-binding protein HU-beta